MNKIFRIVWNGSVDAWVVVSELARTAKGRGASRSLIARPAFRASAQLALAIALALAAVSTKATEIVPPNNNNALPGLTTYLSNFLLPGNGDYKNCVATGGGLFAAQQCQTISAANFGYAFSSINIGGFNTPTAPDLLNTALAGGNGPANHLTLIGAVTSGSYLRLTGSNYLGSNNNVSCLVGLSTTPGSCNLVGLNTWSTNAAQNNQVLVGDGVSANGSNEVVIGTNATHTLPTVNANSLGINGGTDDNYAARLGNSVVIGNSANGSADAQTILGAGATSNQANSVALGSKSNADRAPASGYTAYGLSAPQNSVGAVSVGGTGAERQITHVAAGSDNYDAVNVLQLNGALNAIDAASGFAVKYDPSAADPSLPNYASVTLGNGNGPTTIGNLAAGQVAAGSAQAINGDQLFKTNAATTKYLGGGAAFDSVSGNWTSPSYTIGSINSVGDNTSASYGDVGSAFGAVNNSLGGLNTHVNTLDSQLTQINNGGGIKYFRANSTLADSNAVGADSLASGPRAQAIGNGSIAQGLDAQALGNNSLALGNGAQAIGLDSIAVGHGNVVGGAGSGAFGDPNTVIGNASYAIGNNNTITANKAFVLGNNVAIGSGLDGAVALGDASTVAAAAAAASGVVNGVTYAYAGGAPLSVVSVGSAGNERQLTNLAAGQLTAASTDAVNGSQLHATNQAVNGLGAQVSGNNGSIGALQQDALQWNSALGAYDASHASGSPQRIANVAAGALGAGSTDAVNGAQLNATNLDVAHATSGLGALANGLGGGASYDPVSGISTAPSYTSYNADGSTATVDNVGAALAAINSQGIKYFHANSTGADSRALGIDSVAIGSNAAANNAGDVALGSGSTTAATVANAGATIAGAAYAFAGATPAAALSVGGRQIQNVAAGQLSADSTDAVNGSQLNATNQAVDGIAGSVTNLGNSAVQYDKNPGGTPNYASITLAGPSSTDGGLTGGSRIGNVAQGTLSITSTDAVNGAQLYATNQTISSIAGGGGIKYFHVNSTGADSSAVGADSVAIGQGAVAGSANDVALGAGSITAGTALTSGAILNGSSYAFAGAAPIGTLSVGAAGSERTISNVAAGQLTAASTDAVNGSQLDATNQAVNGLGTQVASNAGSLGVLQQNALQWNQALGAYDASHGSEAPQRITRLAAGVLAADSTDAVNGAQLFGTNNALAQYLGGGASFNPSTGQWTAPGFAISTIDSQGGSSSANYGNAGDAFSAVNNSLGNLNTHVNNLGNQLSDINTAVDNTTKYFRFNSMGPDANATGDNSAAIGSGAVANGISSFAGGLNTAAIGDYSIAMGTESQALSKEALALGHGAIAQGGKATAIGVANVATGNGAVAVGDPNVATGTGAVAIGADNTATGDGAVALGNKSVANGQSTVALGNAAQATAAGALAIGNAATASAAGSVALGAGSSDDGRGVESYVGSYSGAQNNTTGTVSIGAAGAERTLSHVADGKQATDAVNLRQLDGAVQQFNGQVSTVQNNVSNLTTQVTQVQTDVGHLQNGTDGFSQVNNTSNLSKPVASGSDTTAVGAGAVAAGDRSLAVGTSAVANAANAVALGSGSVADRADSVSVGSVGQRRQLTNVAAGTASTDAVNVSQLQASQAGGVKYDTVTQADGSTAVDYGNVTLGKSDTPTAIHNVANGVRNGDAANVGQVTDGLNQVANWSKSYTDSQVSGLRSELKSINNRANAGVAGAMAMAGLPQAYTPGKSMAALAASSFQGESSMALGVSTISEGGSWVYKLNASVNSRGDGGVSLGAGMQW